MLFTDYLYTYTHHRQCNFRIKNILKIVHVLIYFSISTLSLLTSTQMRLTLDQCAQNSDDSGYKYDYKSTCKVTYEEVIVRKLIKNTSNIFFYMS